MGRAIPAAEVPWMRVREVWLHAIDLDTGATVEDIPSGVVDLLADDVTAALSDKPDCPALLLAPTDRDRTWGLGAARFDLDAHAPATGAPHPVLHAPAAIIVGWITGRIVPVDLPEPVPPLPAWL
jgi:maleylpyruvate isomerase